MEFKKPDSTWRKAYGNIKKLPWEADVRGLLSSFIRPAASGDLGDLQTLMITAIGMSILNSIYGYLDQVKEDSDEGAKNDIDGGNQGPRKLKFFGGFKNRPQ